LCRDCVRVNGRERRCSLHLLAFIVQLARPYSSAMEGSALREQIHQSRRKRRPAALDRLHRCQPSKTCEHPPLLPSSAASTLHAIHLPTRSPLCSSTAASCRSRSQSWNISRTLVLPPVLAVFCPPMISLFAPRSVRWRLRAPCPCLRAPPPTALPGLLHHLQRYAARAEPPRAAARRCHD
jgi:hypothetical protein